VHDAVWQPAAAPVPLAGPLAFLRLNDAWPPHDLPEIVNAITNKPGNFLLLGDHSLLYGATGRPSVLPVLWMHIDLTTPRPRTREFAAFETRVLEQMQRHHASYLVLEEPWSWSGVSLASFPRLSGAVAGCPSTTLGRWRIVDLCRGIL
jgi:hypothetical protein